MEGSTPVEERKHSTKCHSRKKRASFHLSSAPSLCRISLSSSSFFPPSSSLTPADVQSQAVQRIRGKVSSVFFLFSVLCDLPGRAPQWVSAPLRVRRVVLLSFQEMFARVWVFNVRLSRSALLCGCFWPTACCFLWDVAFSTGGICFGMSSVILPFFLFVIPRAKVKETFAKT